MAAEAVIINADDLGLWPSVNEGILEAWARGAISDSTVLANAANLPALLEQARAARLPVGIHLNLTLGRPLSDHLPTLAPQGVFMKRQQWLEKLPVDEIKRELGRQVARVLGLEWQPSHLDSHHHIHQYPQILPIVIELARTLDVPVRAVDDNMRRTLRNAGIRTTDHFTMRFYGEQATVETLIAEVEAVEGGVLEIMAHPGYSAADLPSSYRTEREQELRTLLSPQFHAYLRERKIPVMGFQDSL